MSKVLEQESEIEITESVEAISIEDIDISDEIREWLQTPPVQIKNFGFDEVDSEEGYNAIQEELSSYLMER